MYVGMPSLSDDAPLGEMTALETPERMYPSYWYHWFRMLAQAFILAAEAWTTSC